MNKSKLLRFMMVLVPYFILLGVTIYSYADVKGSDLDSGAPKILLLIPAVISLMLPTTYGALIFGIKDNPRPTATLLVGIFMGVTLLILAGVVYLIAS
ncbi:MAG: hypothetical protein PHV74_07480 [Dehalococcoidia bacterium]|nr:hypothetical protein [Dehalococcoidia bacterium]